MTERKLLKSEKIRLKNDKLRAKGKDPLKGWGRMIDTGFGGLNKAGGGFGTPPDTKAFIADQQKEIARENDTKRQ